MDSERVTNTEIEGVTLTKKMVFRDGKGAVLHMVKKSSPNFNDDFGEIYFSKVKKNIIKGWKIHHEYSQRIVVPYGKVRFVLIDHRETSPSYRSVTQCELSEESYSLLTIPPNLIYGFMGIAEGESLLANFSSGEFREGESSSFTIDDSRFGDYRKYFS